MKASVGDQIDVRGRHVGEGSRQGEIIDVRGSDGEPPYLVRWSDGHEGLFFPGSDAAVRHVGTAPAR